MPYPRIDAELAVKAVALAIKYSRRKASKLTGIHHQTVRKYHELFERVLRNSADSR